ncbi:MAG: hypothetical protein ACF8Q5_07870 [Phycisphaerales bacterium JB040]
MKKVLAWVKGHLVVVICTALILVSLPVAYVFSSGWRKSNTDEAQKLVQDQERKVSGLEVTYTVPVSAPGGEPVERRFMPNDAYIQRFKALLEQQRGEERRVAAAGLAFNRHAPLKLPPAPVEPAAGEGFGEPAAPVPVDPNRPQTPEEADLEEQMLAGRTEAPMHTVLVEGLFPDPGRSQFNLQTEFIERLAGLRGRTSVYAELHERLNAGMPPEPDAVLRRLQSREEQIRSEALPDDPDLAARLRKDLRETRLSAYQARATRLNLYLDEDALFFASASPIPATIPNDELPLWQLFEWQWDYWVVSDVLTALERANTTDRGRRLPIDQAPVKRVESISVEPLPVNRGGAESRSAEVPTAASRPPQPDNDGVVGTWDGWSLTGRYTHPGNQVYDIRYAYLTLVVDSTRIPQVLDAFPVTNFMTVIDMDIEAIDAEEHLREGFAYGPDPVVRVTLTVETAWLRSWTVPLMPESVKTDLGVQESMN